MIELKHINKSYHLSNISLNVLEDISLKVDKKDVFGLMGPTGSGKSTLLRIMSGFIKPDSGDVFLFGNDLNHTKKETLISETSMIFQNFNLLSNITVLENVALPLKLRKVKKEERLKKALDALVFVGLELHKDAYISTLSGGQKQRVSIARAIITDPKIIFCDEPTSALDEKTTYDILSLLKKINHSFDTTLILVSHDISVIKSMCNKVAIIEDGRINQVIKRCPQELLPTSYLEALI